MKRLFTYKKFLKFYISTTFGIPCTNPKFYFLLASGKLFWRCFMHNAILNAPMAFFNLSFKS